MCQWTVTIPTVRNADGQVVRGTQTWVVDARMPQHARDLARAAATTPEAVRHRRGAALDTTSVDVALWQTASEVSTSSWAP